MIVLARDRSSVEKFHCRNVSFAGNTFIHSHANPKPVAKDRIDFYNQDDLLVEISNTGVFNEAYAQDIGIDNPLAALYSNSVRFLEADALGSITTSTDSNGVILNTYGYDSYGTLTSLRDKQQLHLVTPQGSMTLRQASLLPLEITTIF